MAALRDFIRRHTPVRLLTAYRLRKNRNRPGRRLDIGPGPRLIPGFETMDIVPSPYVDYVGDVSRRLPFEDGTFELIHASHVLEHVPWYRAERTLREWTRVLRAGGWLEIWVPDALGIAKALVDMEENGVDIGRYEPRWFPHNPQKDPCLWATGRLFRYADEPDDLGHPGWHRALFTPRYLKRVMEQSGLVEVTRMDRSEVRGHDHGWINLGMKGRKPCTTAT